MKVLCVLGEHQYGNPDLGAGTEFCAFTAALRRLGHEVVHFESWNRSTYPNYADSNRQLLEAVERERPDVLLSVQRDYEIWLETLDIIRSRGDVATISWTTDDSWKYKRTSRYIGRSYDAMTTTYDYVVPDYERDGIPVLLTQWAASAEWLAEPLPAKDCTYGVSFVGAAHGDRKEQVAALRKRGIKVECFGAGWDGGAIPADQIPRIMRQSLISLNFANAFQGAAEQIKARTFEVPGAGGLLLTKFVPGLERLYEPGREIVVFHDFEEMIEKIIWLQNNPADRDAIAFAGFRRTRSEHTYDQRMHDVLDFALHAKKLSTRKAPPRDIDRLLRAHKLSGWHRGLRDVLVAAGKSVWGEKRGPRAARRLVFEASWRIFGARTYTAAGLPGRLFPEQ